MAEGIAAFLRVTMQRWRSTLAGSWSYALIEFYPGVLAFLLVAVYLIATANIGFSLQDEGHLWYGSQRVLAGEIPLRDFQGYDPGRYYWAAAVMALMHSDGWVAMRVAGALFAAIGIAIACMLCCRDRVRANWLLVLLAIGTLYIWLPGMHKLYDVTASVVLVALLAWLLRQPTHFRCFINGVGVGLIAIIGRNHGLYGAVADVGAIFFLHWAEKRIAFLPSFGWWVVGMLAGYSPMLLAIVFVPQFWTWLWASIHVYFEMGSTNNHVPLPWPWTLDFGAPLIDLIRALMISLLIVLVIPVYGFAVTAYYVWRARAKQIPADPVIFACALVTIPYLHHLFARNHLPQAICPMLIGLLAWISTLRLRKALELSAAMFAVSFFIMVPKQTLYERHQDGNWIKQKIGDDVLSLSPYIAERVDVLTGLVQRYAADGRSFVVTPFLPAAYAIFDRRAAVWDPYSFFPADDAVQQAEISRIQAERPGFIVVEDAALDGNPLFDYQHTNPKVLAFIETHFVKVKDPTIPSFWGWTLYLPPQPSRH